MSLAVFSVDFNNPGNDGFCDNEMMVFTFLLLLLILLLYFVGDACGHISFRKRCFCFKVAAIRAVATNDYMTADWYRMPYDLLAVISNRIINEVKGINRVCYDISSKPPATIEWE
jgi:hypothetical protein